MTGAPWHRVKEILAEALELPAASRRAFVARACEGDAALLGEVESLLETHGQGEGFLESADIPAGIADAIRREGQPLAPAGRARPRVCPTCSARFEDGALFCPHDDEVLVEDPTALVGETLDGLYEIEAVVGEGGMGAVYRARHVVLGDRVAIKVIRGEMSVHPEWLRRFRREGQAARRFKHPNAVTVHDLRTSSDGTTYMVMEYVEGRTLRDELRERGRLTLDEAVRILEPIASALDHAHSLGIVHRDLKPENVIIGGGPDAPLVKLLDLGLARLFETSEAGGAATNVTSAGQAIGTPIYMPPEQWGQLPEDGGSDIDARADVYSLGVMLFEMVSGRRPFEGSTANALRIAHSRDVPPALSGIVPGLPQSASDAVARALAKDRSGRQASAGELLAELRPGAAAPAVLAVPQPIEPQPVEPQPIEPSQPAPVQPRPRPAFGALANRLVTALALITATTLIVVIVGLGFAGRLPHQLVNAPSDAEPRPAVAPRVDERSLQLALAAQRTRGGETRVEPFSPASEMAFGDGDGVRVEATSSHDGYLYVINESPVLDAETALPRYTIIFPKPTVNSGSPRVDANAAVRVPDGTWLKFFGPSGRETLWVIWSAQPIDALRDVDELVTTRRLGQVTEQSQVECIRRFLASRAAPDLRVADDPHTGTRIATSGDVIVFPLYLEHR
jgi:serine/threonine protein kinase